MASFRTFCWNVILTNGVGFPLGGEEIGPTVSAANERIQQWFDDNLSGYFSSELLIDGRHDDEVFMFERNGDSFYVSADRDLIGNRKIPRDFFRHKLLTGMESYEYCKFVFGYIERLWQNHRGNFNAAVR